MSGMGHLAATLRLVARGIAARGKDELPLETPRRKPSVERTGIMVDARSMERYLRATRGEGLLARSGGEPVSSPLFPATWETAAALELFSRLDQPLPLGGVVHQESEILPLRPLRPGDHVRCRVELEKAERARKGIRLTLSTRNWNASGQLCSESTAVFLARSRVPADAPAHEPRPTRRDEGDPRGEPPEEWTELVRWSLRGDAGRKYARVSGDYNPIHLWPWSARAFGFRRPILHGFCTAAMVGHALVEHRLGGDTAALRRLRIAFRAPLPLPSRVRLLTGEGIGQRWFRVVDEEGETVHAEGTWGGAPSVTSLRDS